MDKHLEVVINKHGLAAAPITPQLFGNAGKEHMEKYGEFLWWLIYNRSLLSEKNSLPLELHLLIWPFTP